MRLEADRGGESGEAVACGGHLVAADIRFAEDDLPMQVGDIDLIVVDEAQPADTGGRQIECQRRTEPAHADDEHRALQQPRLAGPADLGQHDVPGVASKVIVVQRHTASPGLPGARPPGSMPPVNPALTLIV